MGTCFVPQIPIWFNNSLIHIKLAFLEWFARFVSEGERGRERSVCVCSHKVSLQNPSVIRLGLCETFRALNDICVLHNCAKHFLFCCSNDESESYHITLKWKRSSSFTGVSWLVALCRAVRKKAGWSWKHLYASTSYTATRAVAFAWFSWSRLAFSSGHFLVRMFELQKHKFQNARLVNVKGPGHISP